VKRVLVPCFALSLAACGTNRPEIPKELLDNPSTGSNVCTTPDYPSGPYGDDTGTFAQDRCFRGWKAPQTTAHDAATLEDISLGNFYDPTGAKYELVLLNTAAIWCSVCKSEHKTLPDKYAEYGPRGLVLLSALFQNGQGAPAELSDLTTWVETFDTPFPMVLDPDYQLGDYATADTAPLNLVIDARTMRSLAKFSGNQSEPLWSTIEDELARREASE